METPRSGSKAPRRGTQDVVVHAVVVNTGTALVVGVGGEAMVKDRVVRADRNVKSDELLAEIFADDGKSVNADRAQIEM